MGDCHSSDPGSNPGPGALSSVRIPTTSIIDHKNNKEHIINSETTATISIVQQQKNRSFDNCIYFRYLWTGRIK